MIAIGRPYRSDGARGICCYGPLMSVPEQHLSEEDAAFLAGARQFLAQTALDHALRIEWHDTPRDRVECTFPRQPGLDFDLWVTVWEHDMRFGSGEDWWAEIWDLIDGPDPWSDAGDILDGFIAGDVRVLCYRPLGRRKVSGSTLQRWHAAR